MSQLNVDTLGGQTGTTISIASGHTLSGVASTNGITNLQQFRLNANLTSNAQYITANWEAPDSDYESIGSIVSESSGVFTFPSTGFWKIDWNFETVQNNDEYLRIKMMFGGSSGNNSTVNEDVSGANATGYASVSSSAIIKCTDVADKFTFYNSTSNGSIDGDSGSNRSGFTCIKINDV